MTSDFSLDEVCEALRQAGHNDLADRTAREFRRTVEDARAEAAGWRHKYENVFTALTRLTGT